jgi:hypothetical protein
MGCAGRNFLGHLIHTIKKQKLYEKLLLQVSISRQSQ